MMAATQKNLHFLVHKVLTPQKKLYTYKTIIYCGICCFLMKKAVWDIIITFVRLCGYF
jgi:hypothetical protein